jgi:hypothetical protein
MAATPADRQVVITAPPTMQPGQAATVQVQLTASGDQTLPDVQLALQVPQGWTAAPTGPTEFTSVPPGTAPAATFQVTPPSYAPNTGAVVHATGHHGEHDAGGRSHRHSPLARRLGPSTEMLTAACQDSAATGDCPMGIAPHRVFGPRWWAGLVCCRVIP